MKKHLQYAFFLNAQNRIIPCDSASKEFLKTIDADAFLSHLETLQLNTSNTATTIVLNQTGYMLRLIPVPLLDKPPKEKLLEGWNSGYVVVLQDQVSLSSVMQTISKNIYKSESFEDFFSDYDTGIYVTRADGVSMFINNKYEEITMVRRTQAVGHTIYDLSKQGLYMPLVTPVILQTNKEYTVFQNFAGGRSAIISGTPIYDSAGSPYCVLICINQIDEDAKYALLSYKDSEPQGLRREPGHKYVENSQIDIIAESPAMRQVLQDSIRVAHFDVPVLLLGESGTGKEIFATIIHSSSEKRFNPYVAINCSAISPSLLEAELFGYEAGSFTGASSKGKPGLFEVATNGTIFLDEIGDMPMESQAKILRVLQNGEFYRVGGITPIKTNARIVAATNKDLKKMVSEGTFRNDLYYRLNVIPITLPPLRERREDILPLLLHFTYVFNQSYGTNKQFSPELIEELVKYPWPGNVRELKNLVKRLIIMCVDEKITPQHYRRIAAAPISGGAPEGIDIQGQPTLSEATAYVEKTLVQRALEKGGNTRKAAAILGVSQTTVMRKIKDYGIALPKEN